jgi:hypothetical protein
VQLTRTGSGHYLLSEQQVIFRQLYWSVIFENESAGYLVRRDEDLREAGSSVGGTGHAREGQRPPPDHGSVQFLLKRQRL